MIFAAILVGVIGAVLVAMGCLIWKKEKIALLHDYHYDKVREEDRAAFCKISGIGILLIGLGLLVCALLLGITDSAYSFFAFAFGFAAGLVLLIRAGRRYNH